MNPINVSWAACRLRGDVRTNGGSAVAGLTSDGERTSMFPVNLT